MSSINMFERMQTQEPFRAYNHEMPLEKQSRAAVLCKEYNDLMPGDREGQLRVLKELLGTCAELSIFNPPFYCDYGFNIHTSGLTVLNHNVVILDTSPVHFGENVFVGPGTVIACAGHALDARQRAEGLLTSAPITIGNDVWIGANCTIMGGVTIGDGSVIGAGSVVNRDIPAGVVAAGTPCRVMRKVTEEDKMQMQ